jgi:hypothetical protein
VAVWQECGTNIKLQALVGEGGWAKMPRCASIMHLQHRRDISGQAKTDTPHRPKRREKCIIYCFLSVFYGFQPDRNLPWGEH